MVKKPPKGISYRENTCIYLLYLKIRSVVPSCRPHETRKQKKYNSRVNLEAISMKFGTPTDMEDVITHANFGVIAEGWQHGGGSNFVIIHRLEWSS